MSDNDIPIMEGFSVEPDPLTDVWIATSRRGTYKFRGRNEAELNAARWDAYGRLIEQFRAATAELFPGGREIGLQTPVQPVFSWGLDLPAVRLLGRCPGERAGRDPPGPAVSPGTARPGRRGGTRAGVAKACSRRASPSCGSWSPGNAASASVAAPGGPLRSPAVSGAARCARGRGIHHDRGGRRGDMNQQQERAIHGRARGSDTIDHGRGADDSQVVRAMCGR
jgi:hypothetical protein